VTKYLLFTLLFIFIPTQAQVVGTSAPNAELDSNEYDLTDADRWEAENYIHQGLTQRTMEEECKKLDDPDACLGRGKTKFMGVDSSIVEMVSKVYSLFSGAMGMQGGGFKAKAAKGSDASTEGTPTDSQSGTDATDSSGNSNSTGKKEGEGKKDYCAYIPAAGELVATTMQTLGQQEIETSKTQESQQKAQLYSAARSHRTRAQTAKIQGTTWGATTACYGYYMAAGGIAIDWKVMAKAAGAGFLTMFWLSESKKQNAYADEVNAIADELPGKGDCNPHTQKNCYCSQPETQYDTANCLEILNKKITDTTSYSVPCVDKDLKSDATCTCVGTQNCFDTEFFSNLSGTGLANFGNTSAGKDFKKLTNGILTNAKLASSGSGTNASAQKFLKDLDGKITELPNLTKTQSEQANSLKSYGIPKSVASLIASQTANSFGKDKAASLSNGRYGKINGLVGNTPYKSAGAVLRFNNPTKQIGKKSGQSYNSISNMLNKLKKNPNSGNSAKVLKFAQQAEREAQITKNKDRPIFEIISRRYQVSGWRRLDIE